jgi:hypothetical protein
LHIQESSAATLFEVFVEVVSLLRGIDLFSQMTKHLARRNTCILRRVMISMLLIPSLLGPRAPPSEQPEQEAFAVIAFPLICLMESIVDHGNVDDRNSQFSSSG